MDKSGQCENRNDPRLALTPGVAIDDVAMMPHVIMAIRRRKLHFLWSCY